VSGMCSGGREALMEKVLGDGERVAERRLDGLRVENLLLVDERKPLREVVHRPDLLGPDMVSIEQAPVHRAPRVRVLDHRLELPQMEPLEIGARHGLRVRVPESLGFDLGLVEMHGYLSELEPGAAEGGLREMRPGSARPISSVRT